MLRIFAAASLCLSLALAALSPALAADDAPRPVELLPAHDLSRLAAQSAEQRLPILVMFSADHCTYCIRVEEEFLKPMLRSGQYEEKVIIRKLKIGANQPIVDFDGKRLGADEFAARYSVYVTPTLIFIDGNGRQLAQKRVGLTTPDYYGGYLDESIDTALDVLRRTTPLRVKLSALEE